MISCFDSYISIFVGHFIVEDEEVNLLQDVLLVLERYICLVLIVEDLFPLFNEVLDHSDHVLRLLLKPYLRF